MVTPLPKIREGRVKHDIEYRLEYLPLDLGECWGMSDSTLHALGVSWDPETKRLALPLKGAVGQLRGRVLRVPPGDGRTPKTLTWLYQDAPVLSWWGTPYNESVIIVEDIPSAMRLALKNYRAVALNGTHLNDEAVEELDRNATNVLWALDPDASYKAAQWLVRTRMYFDKSAVLLIDKDIKDMTNEEIDRWLSEISWLRSYGVETPTTGLAPSCLRQT